MPKATQQNLAFPQRRTYVIAGDWVVDENWFLVRHYSELSKHTGEAHYRRLEAADGKGGARADKILELCGAGHVARVLFLERQRMIASSNEGRLAQSPPPDFDLLAIGKWHLDDQAFLTHLVHSGPKDHPCNAGRPGHRIVFPPVCPEPPAGIELYTLNGDAPTFRAVRLYHQRAGDWHIVNRVDWEPPKRDDSDTGADLPFRSHVPVIIIDDLEKGAVTKGLVSKLLKAYPAAFWYVRAKSLKPEWLYPKGVMINKKIQKKLALFVIGPEVAPHLSPFECWHHNGRITQEAMEVLGEVPARNVVLLSERREVIGRFREGPTQSVVIWGKSHVDPSALNQVGWADAVMAGLVHYMNLSPAAEPADVTNETVSNALKVADARRSVTGVPNISSEPGGPTQVDPASPTVRETTKWSVEAERWELARSGLGIIGGTLEVWRASTRLKGYIACIPRKLAILDEIGRHLRAFSRGSGERSLGILIQSDPGSGKSHLAKCLKEIFDFELLACDVSQMIHREELFDFFEKVATRQVSSDRPVLAFVDEVNTPVEASSVYGAFLAPLESNHYARRGQLHTLKPCVWLFTGTNAPASGQDEKHSDFLSRMTLTRCIDYGSLHDGDQDVSRVKSHRADPSSASIDAERAKAKVLGAAKLEQVYFGAAMIIHHFPDVTEVEQRLLQAFHDLEPTASPFRAIRQVAAMLRNVQHGRVTIRNVADLSVLGIDSAKMPTSSAGMVRLAPNA
jgi:hypothetical protein